MACKKPPALDVEAIRDVFAKPFEKALTPLLKDEATAEAMAKRLADMRKHAVERHDYYERYRNQYLAVGLALLPLSFAIGGFVLNFINTAKVDVIWAAGAAAGVITFILTGLAVVFRYVGGTSPNYCYRKVAKAVSWYHAYVDVAGVGDANRLCPDQVRKEVCGFAKALREFGDTWIGAMTDAWRPYAEDLEQVFILFMLQSEKRRQVRSLALCVKWGMSIGAFLLLVGLVMLAFGINTNPS